MTSQQQTMIRGMLFDVGQRFNVIVRAESFAKFIVPRLITSGGAKTFINGTLCYYYIAVLECTQPCFVVDSTDHPTRFLSVTEISPK